MLHTLSISFPGRIANKKNHAIQLEWTVAEFVCYLQLVVYKFDLDVGIGKNCSLEVKIRNPVVLD